MSSHIRISCRSFSFRWRRYFRDFNPIARTSLLFSAKISTPAGSIFPKILAIANPYTFDGHRNENDRCDKKTHKKMSDKRVADSSEKLNSLSSQIRINKNQNQMDMTATMDIRQPLQSITTAILTLVLWVLGIVWHIVKEIINGVFRMAIGFIVLLVSVVGFIGLILWLLTF